MMVAAAMLMAAPAVAQAQAPAPPAAKDGAKGPEMRVYRMQRGPMFGNVSPEGRQVLMEAMRSMTPEDRAALRAARDRVNALVAADRLDVGAVRSAMAEERRLVDAHHAKRQAALLAALPKLSAEDRKAFAEDARKGRRGMEMRSADWQKIMERVTERLRELPMPPTMLDEEDTLI